MNVIVTDKKYITERPVNNTLLVVEDCPSGNPSWRLPKGMYFSFRNRWVNILNVIETSSLFSSSFILSRDDSYITGYKKLVDLSDFVAGAEDSQLENVSTSPTLLKSFATELGALDGAIILHGFFTVHYEVEKSAGTNPFITWAEIYKRDSGGTETLIVTSDNSDEITANTRTQVTLQALLTSDVSFNNDSLVVKVYAQKVSGANRDITLYWDGGIDAHIDLPTSPLSYIPENVSNKTTTIAGNESSTTLYTNVKGVVDWIKEGMTALLSSLGLTKATPVDADSLLLSDSEDSDKLKLLSWANLKATLLTYFSSFFTRTIAIDNATYSTSTSGSEVLLASALIPANTFTNTDQPRIIARYRRISGTNGVIIPRIRIHTSASIAGNIIWGSNRSTATSAVGVTKTLIIKNATTDTEIGGLSVDNDDGFSTSGITLVSYAIDWSVDQYVIFSIVNNGAGDTTALSGYIIKAS